MHPLWFPAATLDLQKEGPMTNTRRFHCLVLVALCLLLAVSSTSAQTITTVMSGLDSPRGLAFGPEGGLYVTEAGEGIAIIPAYGLPACRNRDVAVSRLINPVVTLEFSQVRARGRKLPPDAEDFTSFLQHHIARWAGRAGVL